MESSVKGTSGKKNFLMKTWERCRSGSCGAVCDKKKKVAPEGYFPVYVGPKKQRFAFKTKYANHPIFRMLLEDAEIEYGYNTPGPILLPCEVELFYRVVAKMEAMVMEPHGCGFGYGSCSPFNTSRQIGKGYGGYGLLTPSRLVKMN